MIGNKHEYKNVFLLTTRPHTHALWDALENFWLQVEELGLNFVNLV